MRPRNRSGSIRGFPLAHRALTSTRMAVRTVEVPELTNTNFEGVAEQDVILVALPRDKGGLGGGRTPRSQTTGPPDHLCSFAIALAGHLREGGKLLFFGEPQVLPYLHAAVGGSLTFHHWIAIRTLPDPSGGRGLPKEHRGLTIYSKGLKALDHATVRIGYEYCRLCGRTVKDYGGKKHLYDAYGTLMSDVWKDLAVDPRDILPVAVLDRVRDMFSVGNNRRLLILPLEDESSLGGLEILGADLTRTFLPRPRREEGAPRYFRQPPQNQLLRGDALEILPSLPDESVDLAFADPPYNLSKLYRGYSDDLAADHYFTWSDAWLDHLCRVLRPGGSLAVVNTPPAAMRHLLYLQRRLTFQSWIVWDSMSMPVRRIMPSHYAILVFTKPGALPGPGYRPGDPGEEYLPPKPDGLCNRPPCLADGRREGYPAPALTDLWTDIHRVKHNSRRPDHPCLLPPRLMMRIIAHLTEPGDLVLDCFNGVGTTTLCAQRLGRRYLGIEVDPGYHAEATRRHILLASGGDPFSKHDGTPTVKNNLVRRVPRVSYEVSKKTLQLAVKALAQDLGRIPSREDLERLGPYPMRYYDEYFRNWSEVTAAARATGMSERKPTKLQ